MKKILNILMAALVLTGISCSEDLEYKPGGVTPVQTLLLPADNYYVELQSASNGDAPFFVGAGAGCRRTASPLRGGLLRQARRRDRLPL